MMFGATATATATATARSLQRLVPKTRGKMAVGPSSSAAPPLAMFSSDESSSSSSSSSSPSSSSASSATCDVIQGPSLLRTPVARPSPSLMVLPGLRSLPFWSAPDHSRIAYGDPLVTQVVEHLEQNVKTIRDEYQAKAPTLKSDYEDTGHGGALHEGTWEWHSYMSKGNIQGHFALQFGQTSAILQELRQEGILFEGTPFGFSFFSTLHGGASIQPHTAPMNMRLRIHLPLIVPAQKSSSNSNSNSDDDLACGIRVGNMARPWIRDKALVLDDSYDHEVWNRTSESRVILLVDIWHPDISKPERQEIVNMFQTARKEGLWKR